MYAKHFTIVIILCFFATQSMGQERPVYISDTTQINTEGVRQIKAKNFFDPSRAALLSAVLPGLGQAYNRRYWKIPIVWGGLVLGVYLADFFNNNLQFWRGELFLILNGQTPNTTASQRRVEQIIQRQRRDRDQTVIYTFIWYGLSIVDAHVDAYLKEFDVNDQLSLQVQPYIENNTPFHGQVFGGVSLVLKVK